MTQSEDDRKLGFMREATLKTAQATFGASAVWQAWSLKRAANWLSDRSVETWDPSHAQLVGVLTQWHPEAQMLVASTADAARPGA